MKARTGRNPQTGESIKIKAENSPKLWPEKLWRMLWISFILYILLEAFIRIIDQDEGFYIYGVNKERP